MPDDLRIFPEDVFRSKTLGEKPYLRCLCPSGISHKIRLMRALAHGPKAETVDYPAEVEPV